MHTSTRTQQACSSRRATATYDRLMMAATTSTSTSPPAEAAEMEGAAAPPGAVLLDLDEWVPPMDAEVEALLSGYYGPRRLQQIRRALATAPNHTCLRVNTLRQPASDVLAALQAEDGPLHQAWGDRFAPFPAPEDAGDGPAAAAAAAALVAPVPYIHPTPPLSQDTILVPSLRAAAASEPAGIGKHCLRPGTHVVMVDRVCGEAVLRGAHIFAKGVLCASLGIMWDSPVLILADLHRRVVRGCPWAEYQGTAVVIAQGRACLTRQQMFRAQSGLAVRVTRTAGWLAPPLNDLLPGQVYVQNLPSLAVAHVLRPAAGSTVIDLCACPGGKATHLAALVGRDGLVVACDRTRKKVVEMKRLAHDMGLDGVLHPLIMDSCHVVLPKERRGERGLPSSTPAAVLAAAPPDADGLRKVEGFFPETFDHVLLDPPCSALGLRPRLTLPTKVAELRGHVAFQKIFIWSAILLLKPGGTMTYSTCTLNPEENEAMVRFALDTYKCLRLVPAEPRVGGPGLPNLGLSDEEQGMVQLFDPSATTAGDAPGLDTSGFFCAKFVKVTSVFESGGDGEAGAGGSE